MVSAALSLAPTVLTRFALRLLQPSGFERFLSSRGFLEKLRFAHGHPAEIREALIEAIPSSRSQIAQDLFVLAELGFKRDGFFVEFGATNGVDYSNTLLLEKDFGWSGILAEPARIWHEALVSNRSAKIDFRCVWSENGKSLEFIEADRPILSTLASMKDKDFHKKAREGAKTYKVDTISLKELLDQHQAPKQIDYLSIDTEGSEFDILHAFEFDSYDIKCITCEHNFTSTRAKIHDLLKRNGYRRVFEKMSMFDDWYVRH